MVNAEEIFEKNKNKFIDEWKAFLRFQSISTDNAYHEDCLKCAKWLQKNLEENGFKSRLVSTATKPLVIADFEGDKKLPKILFYGHYDVQPVDPLDLWKTPPFEPAIINERMYARGAVDNKGQSFPVLKSLIELKKAGLLKNPLKILMEGEEESGSAALFSAMPALADELTSDVLLVCDTGTIKAEIPAITVGLRGLVQLELTILGASQDLHSGSHGGIVKNPALEMSKLLSKLFKEDGSIAIPGFYDDVDELTLETKKLINALPISDIEYEYVVGAKPNGGESSFSWLERRGVRPTIEINGLHSGYGGEGGKTIIPASATVKITSRLVASQNPERILKLIKSFIENNAPQGMSIQFGYGDAVGGYISSDLNSKYVKLAQEVLRKNYGVEPVCMWEGGSIPVLAELIRQVKAVPVFVGFEVLGDGSHAPNESFALAQFKRAFLFGFKYFEALGIGK